MLLMNCNAQNLKIIWLFLTIERIFHEKLKVKKQNSSDNYLRYDYHPEI